MNRAVTVIYNYCVIAIVLLGVSNITHAQTKPISLAGNKVASLIDGPESPALAIDIVKAVFKSQDVTVQATTQAWLGSGLRSGKYIGFIDHYSLNEPKNGYVYSKPYLQLNLHIAGREANVVNITRLDKIYRQRLGVENRFANTDMLRTERSVSWARSPSFISNIQQLAEQRVRYIIADKYMLDEFNKLLIANGEAPLYLSSASIYSPSLSVALRNDADNANTLIKQFDANLSAMKESGEYSKLVSLASEQPSVLDEALYAEIIRKW